MAKLAATVCAALLNVGTMAIWKRFLVGALLSSFPEIESPSLTSSQPFPRSAESGRSNASLKGPPPLGDEVRDVGGVDGGGLDVLRRGPSVGPRAEHVGLVVQRLGRDDSDRSLQSDDALDRRGRRHRRSIEPHLQARRVGLEVEVHRIRAERPRNDELVSPEESLTVRWTRYQTFADVSPRVGMVNEPDSPDVSGTNGWKWVSW